MNASKIALLTLFILVGCGLEEDQKTYTKSNASENTAPITSERPKGEASLIPIPASVTKLDAKSALHLTATASATSYKISITGCLSGYTQTDISAATIYVYKGDSACKASLTEFVFNGATYDLTHADAVAFPAGLAAGDSATFVSTAAGAGAGQSTEAERMVVFIDSTLTLAGVDDADTISFSFRQAVKGADEGVDVATVQDNGHTASVSGQNAPNFTIESVTLTGLDGTGNGIWEFKMLCGEALTSSDTICDGVTLTDIKYTLILDTFGGADPSSAQLADAIDGGAAYTAAGASVIAGDVNASTADPYNGGFSTKGAGGNTYLTVQDTARTNIYTDTDMWLILEANDSYTYFKITVTPISN